MTYCFKDKNYMNKLLDLMVLFTWRNKLERKGMWSFDQAKIALLLVQEWPYKNEVIDLSNKKSSKNYYIKNVAFHTYSSKSYPKRLIFCL
jgi:hypothetical protein